MLVRMSFKAGASLEIRMDSGPRKSSRPRVRIRVGAEVEARCLTSFVQWIKNILSEIENEQY